jgi:hypothetical protein
MNAGVLGLGGRHILGVDTIFGQTFPDHLRKRIASDLADEMHIAAAQCRLNRLVRPRTGCDVRKG